MKTWAHATFWVHHHVAEATVALKGRADTPKAVTAIMAKSARLTD